MTTWASKSWPDEHRAHAFWLKENGFGSDEISQSLFDKFGVRRSPRAVRHILEKPLRGKPGPRNHPMGLPEDADPIAAFLRPLDDQRLVDALLREGGFPARTERFLGMKAAIIGGRRVLANHYALCAAERPAA